MESMDALHQSFRSGTIHQLIRAWKDAEPELWGMSRAMVGQAWNWDVPPIPTILIS